MAQIEGKEYHDKNSANVTDFKNPNITRLKKNMFLSFHINYLPVPTNVLQNRRSMKKHCCH